MEQTTLGIGTRLQHIQFGPGVIVGVRYATYLISFIENGIKEIDFIKIDTEGFESEVFEGAKRVLGDIKPNFIQIEFNWHQMFRNKTLNYFAEMLPDYEVYQLIPNGWIKRDPKHPHTNIYEFSNFVFVRK